MSAGGTNRLVGSIYHKLFQRWRARRWEWFRSMLQISPESRLIDVGGYPSVWDQPLFRGCRVDIVNIDVENTPGIETPLAHGAVVRSLRGDGRELPFEDGSYDVAYSNSVIEHVGTRDDQARFAAEMLRVGRAIWVQTPAPACPVEPHFLGVGIHWLPRAWRALAARLFSVRGLLGGHPLSHLREIADHTRLITKKELRAMFPGCVILTERIFGVIPKSYIVIRARS